MAQEPSDQTPSDNNSPKKPDSGSRIAKVIARAGLCSRREAETWVTAGRVTVNGKKVLTPAFNVIEADKIVVDGNPLAARAGTRVWLYHKPAGLVVTEKDPEGRDTIFEALETHGLPRVLTIGRLDINTEGLLMLTNDGGLKRILELPETGWMRRYRVRAHGRVTQDQLDKLKNGMELEGIKYGPIEAELERVQGANVWITVALREGKNREIKNVLGALGLEVNRLIRTSYGPFQLGDIPVGGVLVVRARVLRDQLGRKLAKLAGVDFESPLPDDAAGSELAKNPNQRMRKRDDSSLGRAPRPHGRTGEPKEKSSSPKTRKNAPERRGNFAPYQRPAKEEKPIEKRIVHFSDGRASAEFEPRAKRKRDDEDDRGYSKGKRGDEDRPHRANGDGDRPHREGDRPHRANGDAPRPPRREGETRPHRANGDGPSQRDDRKFGDRKFGDKPRGDRSFGDRKFGDKPRGDRKFGDRPSGDRKFGDRPRREGEQRPRRDGEYKPRRDDGDRANGPRSPRPDGARPARDGASRPPRREHPKRGDGAARRAIAEAREGQAVDGGRPPARSGGPGRPSQSRSGPPRSGPARSGPPRSGAGRPSGPRKTPSRGPARGPSRGKPTGRGPK